MAILITVAIRNQDRYQYISTSRICGQALSMMIRYLIISLILLLFSVSSGNCKDASLTCGNTFIDTGDSRARVLLKCGQPVHREIIGYIESRENGDFVDYIMEAWTYDTGSGRYHIILFKGNRVYNIESEMK